MGRGDKRTKKGKVFKGSFGKSRPKSVKRTKTPATKATVAKTTAVPAKAVATKTVATKKK